MKRLTLVAVAVAFSIGLVGLTGCKKKADPEGMVKFMEELADVIDKNKDDCDKAADAMTAHIEKNKEMLQSAKKMKGEMKPEEAKKMMEKYKDRMMAATKKMIGGAMKCATNKKFAEAQKKQAEMMK